MNHDRLEELLIASSVAELNEKEHTQLNALLRDDAEARAFAARFLATDALLVEALEKGSVENDGATPKGQLLRVVWFSAAAAVLTLTTIVVSLSMSPAKPVAVLAGDELPEVRVLTVVDDASLAKAIHGQHEQYTPETIESVAGDSQCGSIEVLRSPNSHST